MLELAIVITEETRQYFTILFKKLLFLWMIKWKFCLGITISSAISLSLLV